jgi:hypothetical protein
MLVAIQIQSHASNVSAGAGWMRATHVEFVHNILHRFALHVLAVDRQNNLPLRQIGFQICRRSLAQCKIVISL